MDDLVAFMHAQLNEAEKRERTKRTITWQPGDSCPQCDQPVTDITTMGGRGRAETEVEFLPCGDVMPGAEFAERYGQSAADPFVLAEIDAKRLRIEHYLKVCDLADPTKHPDQAYVLAKGAVERSLRFDALPYASRPGYKEKWRP